jgi:hypothetical protein
MMYRIKYLLGILVALFSLVYVLFGVVGWVDGTVKATDLLTCFALASAHIGAGSWLLLSSLRQYRSERRRIDALMRQLIRMNSGRVMASELARLAEISDDDAREYLDRRSRSDAAVIMQTRTGSDVYFFGQQFWNN